MTTLTLFHMLQIRFDWTINLGSLIWGITTLVLAVAAWTDLRWRVSNLETWRKEHQIDSDSRDIIINRMDRILYLITNGREGKDHRMHPR